MIPSLRCAALALLHPVLEFHRQADKQFRNRHRDQAQEVLCRKHRGTYPAAKSNDLLQVGRNQFRRFVNRYENENLGVKVQDG